MFPDTDTTDRQPIEGMDLEDLAAFAEGKLRGAEHRLAITRLASSPGFSQVLATSMRMAQHDAERRRLETIARVKQGAAVTGLAASILLVGALVLWQFFANPGPPSRRDFLAEMPPAKRLTMPETRVWRGASSSEVTKQSTELGGLLVDLDVAAARGETQRAAEILTSMAAILDAAGARDDAEALRQISRASDAEHLRTTVAGRLPALEQRMRQQLSSFYLDLGTFAEEAQIAALNGREGFLRTRRVARYCGWLLEQRQEPLSPSVRESLSTLNRTDSTAEEIAEAASAILRFPTS